MSIVAAQISKLLTNVSNKINPEGFLSEEIFPVLNVKQQSGKIGKHSKDHLRIVNTVVVGAGKAPKIEISYATASTYYIDTHALRAQVTKEDYANVELPFKAEEDRTSALTILLKLSKEKALADTLADTAVVTQNVTLSGTGQLSDYANSDPIGKFLTAREAVLEGCGFEPNVAWMDTKVAGRLAFHPGILEALGYTQARAGQLSPEELAKAMGVEKLLIGKAVYNSAHLGQTDALGRVWGKHIWFGHIPKAAGLDQQSAGYHVKFAGEGSYKVFKEAVSISNGMPTSTDILTTDDYDQVLTDVTCLYLIKNAIA